MAVHRVSPRDTEAMERDLADATDDLRRYVARLVAPDRELAEDLVQETLLRAWQHADRLDWRSRPIRQWLFRVARNLAVDAWRANRSVPVGIAADAFDPRPDRHDLAEVVTDREFLLAGLRRIPPRHQEILVQVHLLGRAGKDVATALDIPGGTVKSRTHHAVQALRVALDLEGAAA